MKIKKSEEKNIFNVKYGKMNFWKLNLYDEKKKLKKLLGSKNIGFITEYIFEKEICVNYEIAYKKENKMNFNSYGKKAMEYALLNEKQKIYPCIDLFKDEDNSVKV